MIEKAKIVLVLSPHTDDGEFGCGGMITKLIENGARVIYLAFSAAEQSVLPHLPKDILRTEVRLATGCLGVEKSDLVVLDYEVRKFPEYRQEILEDMIRIQRDLNPDLVLLPSLNDTHQDHNVVANEGFRAFKRTTMLGYEVPWNNLDFRTSCFVTLEERHAKAKIAALSQYKSQAHRNYASEEYIRSLMLTRGTQIGTRYAEVFELIRLIW